MRIPTHFLLVSALTLLAQSALASPAAPGPFPFRQPDGTGIVLNIRGDEWFHWYETPDGRPASLDPASGFWVYRLPSAPGASVLSKQRVGLDLSQSLPWQPHPSDAQMKLNHVWPSVFKTSGFGATNRSKTLSSSGTAFVPIIFSDFSDVKHTVSSSTISNNLFATGPGVRSMATYYREVSFGKFTVGPGPSGVQDWVTVPNAAAYYAVYSSPSPPNPQNLNSNAAVFVRDAVLAAIAAGYKFSPYNQAGDGKVPVVDVVHAGRGEEDGGGPNVIWSHRGKLSNFGLGPIAADGGMIIDDYVVEAELQTNASTHANAPSTVGVFCHEFGHALGLPDLYDTDKDNVSFGAGAWSVMGAGTWNAISRPGDCPAHFDAWCKTKLGWVNPINYTLNYQNVQFPYAASNAFAARVWKDGLASSQYFLIENRYRAGFDTGLPSSGLLIWHIDDTQGVAGDNSDNTKEWFPVSAGGLPPNTNNGNYHVALVQADNLWQLETANVGDAGDPFPGSSNNRLFGPNTAPNSYAYNAGLAPGYNSFVTVSNISDPGLVMTADLYTRSPNSGPSVDWVNVAGTVPPASGAQFVQLDSYHPVVVRAFPGLNGVALSQVQLYINRSLDGRWWDFSSQQWETNATSSTYNVTSSQQYGLTLAFESGLPAGTNLANGGYTFIVRVIDAQSVVTEIQMAMTAAHAPAVTLSLADNSVVNTLTNFTAVATESSGIGVQRVEIALYWDGGATEGGLPVRWYWSGAGWSTSPLWLGVDFPTHPAQATLYYPIGPDAPNLLTEKQYTIAARAVDALGEASTNIISVFYDPGTAATIYWRYPGNGNWFDPANWTPSRVPLPTDQAVVNAPGDYTVTINGAISVGSLRFGRVVGLNRQHLSIPVGGFLTLGGADTNQIYANATLDQGGAISAGRLRFSSGAAWNWTNGSVAASAELRPGAILTISGSSQKMLGDGASLLNEGAISWLGGAPITAYGYSAPSMITNLPGAIFQLAGDGELFNQSSGYYTMIFANAGGLFAKTAGTNTVVDTCLFVNASEVRADSGTISFNATLQLSNGASFTGVGSHRVTGGTVGIAGVTTVADSTLELAAAQFQGAGDNSATFATAGAGQLIWSGGALGGTINLAANAQALINGNAPKTFLDNAVLDSRGQITWSAGLILAYGYTAPSFIRNRAGAVFTITGTNAASRSSGYWFGQFENQPGATLVLNTPGESPWTAWQLINNGVVSSVAGTLRLDAGGASSGLFTDLAGTELRFTGGAFALHAATRFTGPGAVRVAGATLTADGYVPAGATNSPGLFVLDSGAVNGVGFTSLGLFQWNGGTVGGTFSNAPGAVFTVAGLSQTVLDDGAVFNNAGMAQITGGRIFAYGYSANSTWNNLAGAHFDISTDGGLFSQLSAYQVLTFNNSLGARFAKIAGTNSVVDTCVLNNSGELRSDSGTLAFNTALNLNPGGAFTGAGRHDLTGGAVFWNGANTVQGITVNLSGATVTGLSNATLVTSSGGLFNWSGGTVAGAMNLPAGSTLQISGAGSKLLADGAVFNNSGAALFTGAGRLNAYGYSAASIWNNLVGGHFDISTDGGVFGQINGYHALNFNNSPGARLGKTAGTSSILDMCVLNNSGELRSDSGTLAFNATLNLDSGSTFTGAGRHEITGGSVSLVNTTTVQGATLAFSGGALAGGSGATLATTAGGLFDWSGGTLSGAVNFAAGGSFQLSGPGTKTMLDGAVLNNSGAIGLVGTGPLQATGYSDISTFNNLAGGVIQVVTNATWGRINAYHRGLLNNSGRILLNTSPEIFQADWDYTQSAAGTLSLLVAGGAAGTQFSQANFGGNVSLNGALSVVLAGGFAPTNNQSFAMLNYLSHSGQFSSPQLPVLSGGLSWNLTYGASALTMSVIQPTLVANPALLSNGHFQFNITGPPASALIIEGSTDLVSWVPLVTNSPFSGSFLFDDAQAASYGSRFYGSLIIP